MSADAYSKEVLDAVEALKSRGVITRIVILPETFDGATKRVIAEERYLAVLLTADGLTTWPITPDGILKLAQETK